MDGVTHTDGPSTSDIDDYMSDAYTAVDLRPGIVKTHAELRNLKLEAKRIENVERLRNILKRSEIEKKLRDDGLAKPVSEDSKGFLLLSKMGYKPGMSIGLEKEGCSQGIKVPLSLELKTGRTGLGHDTEQENKRKLRVELYQKAVLERAKANDALVDDFSERKRYAAYLKQLSKDLGRSRKVCQELDVRIGLEFPISSHFWPIFVVKSDEVTLAKRKRTEVAEDSCESFTYFNGKPAPDDINADELPECEVVRLLTEVTNYLRFVHYYCIWCGSQYDSKEDLENSCPGRTREEHENNDDD